MQLESNYCPGSRDAVLQHLFTPSSIGSGNCLASVAIILTDDNYYTATDSYSHLLPVWLMLLLLLVLMGATWIILSLCSPKGASLKKCIVLLLPMGTCVISAAHKRQPSNGPLAGAPESTRPVTRALSLDTPHHPPLKLKVVL